MSEPHAAPIYDEDGWREVAAVDLRPEWCIVPIRVPAEDGREFSGEMVGVHRLDDRTLVEIGAREGGETVVTPHLLDDGAVVRLRKLPPFWPIDRRGQPL